MPHMKSLDLDRDETAQSGSFAPIPKTEFLRRHNYQTSNGLYIEPRERQSSASPLASPPFTASIQPISLVSTATILLLRKSHVLRY